MLAKLWKNILLAICIIAILFNITSKLVRRYSLDEQLNSVVGGESLSEILKDEKNKEKNTSKTTNQKKNNKYNTTNEKKNNNNKNYDEDEYSDEIDEDYNSRDLDDEEYYEEDSEGYDDEESDIEEDNDINIEYNPKNSFIDFDELLQDYLENSGF